MPPKPKPKEPIVLKHVDSYEDFLVDRVDSEALLKNKNKSISSISSGMSTSSISELWTSASAGKIQGDMPGSKGIANVAWPQQEDLIPDSIIYEDDDNVSIRSMDMTLWKSAPSTDNEAPRIINKKELKQHNIFVDGWIAVRGRVFDVTGFIDEHPGGPRPICKEIGTDGTATFNRVHVEVDPSRFVGHYCVGIYVKNFDPSKLPKVVSHLKHNDELDDQESETAHKKQSRGCWPFKKRFKDDPGRHFDLRFAENENVVILVVSTPGSLKEEEMGPDCWSFVVWDREMLFIKVMWNPEKCWIAQYRLQKPIAKEIIWVSFSKDGHQARLMLRKTNKEKWKKFGEPEMIFRNCTTQFPGDVDFDDSTRALLFYRKQLSSSIAIYGFKLRPSSYFGVPIGYSIILTVNETGARCFPTSFTFMGCQEPVCQIKGQTFYLLIAQDFHLTQTLNEMNSMDKQSMMQHAFVCIGNPRGDFPWSYIEQVDTLVLIANGVGIAPLTRILRHFKNKHPESMQGYHVLLLYFNRTKGDIIWRHELLRANADLPWFHLFLIVEEPDASWDQLTGKISVHLIKWCINAIPGVCREGIIVNGLASGDRPFLLDCQRVFESMQDFFDNAAMFRAPEEINS